MAKKSTILNQTPPLSPTHTHNPRSNFGTELMEGLNVAIGGLNHQNTPHKVDTNMETDEWQEADDISCSGLKCIELLLSDCIS